MTIALNEKCLELQQMLIVKKLTAEQLRAIMWRRIRHIIIKEFIQVFRDKKLRFFLIVPPLMQLLAYGYVVNFDIKHVAMAVFDESRTMESRQLIDRFASNDWFKVKY